MRISPARRKSFFGGFPAFMISKFSNSSFLSQGLGTVDCSAHRSLDSCPELRIALLANSRKLQIHASTTSPHLCSHLVSMRQSGFEFASAASFLIIAAATHHIRYLPSAARGIKDRSR